MTLLAMFVLSPAHADSLLLDGQPLVEVARKTEVGDRLVLELGELDGDWPQGKEATDVCVFLPDDLAKEVGDDELRIVTLGASIKAATGLSSDECTDDGGTYLEGASLVYDTTLTLLEGEEGTKTNFVFGTVVYGEARANDVGGGLCIIDNVSG